jgi:hypothetical protein
MKEAYEKILLELHQNPIITEELNELVKLAKEAVQEWQTETGISFRPMITAHLQVDDGDEMTHIITITTGGFTDAKLEHFVQMRVMTQWGWEVLVVSQDW